MFIYALRRISVRKNNNYTELRIKKNCVGIIYYNLQSILHGNMLQLQLIKSFKINII